MEHSKKAYKHRLLKAAAAKYVGDTKGSVADMINSDIGNLAKTLTRSQFSQTQESAAGDYAYKFLVDNGRDPNALITAF